MELSDMKYGAPISVKTQKNNNEKTLQRLDFLTLLGYYVLRHIYVKMHYAKIVRKRVILCLRTLLPSSSSSPHLLLWSSPPTILAQLSP